MAKRLEKMSASGTSNVIKRSSLGPVMSRTASARFLLILIVFGCLASTGVTLAQPVVPPGAGGPPAGGRPGGRLAQRGVQPPPPPGASALYFGQIDPVQEDLKRGGNPFTGTYKTPSSWSPSGGRSGGGAWSPSGGGMWSPSGGGSAGTRWSPSGGGGTHGTDPFRVHDNAEHRRDESRYKSLILQTAEQDTARFGFLSDLLNLDAPGVYNDVFDGIQAFFDTTIGLGWLPNMGQLVAKWLTEFVQGWMAPLGRFLIYWMIQFAYNPDVSVAEDEFSKQVRGMARGVRDLANDLLLLFFILSIWRHWSSAASGRGSIMGAVGRIVVAAAAIIAWPTIYHYTILISNSAINLFLPADNQYALEVGRAVFAAFYKALDLKSGILPYLPSEWSVGTAIGTIGAAIGILIATFLQIILVIIVGISILIALVGFYVMKTIQLVLVVAAYPFAPFFLCLLVSPDTESYASSFIRSFVEATFWTFIWAGFIRLLVLLLAYT